jgi:Domain of unknown function (DUF222)
VIVRTTLAELDYAAHAVSDPDVSMPAPARTGGDTAVPMRDVIRMGADGIHYPAVFDDHSERPIYLGRQNRVATADQRIICYAEDRGSQCKVHHIDEWAARRPLASAQPLDAVRKGTRQFMFQDSP